MHIRISQHDSTVQRFNGLTTERGAVLLEVVLALILFVAAAAIVSGGLNASLDGLERLRLNTHAANLAVSVLSELQMGSKSPTLSGAQPCDAPMEGWTWEAIATPMQSGSSGESGGLKKVEIVIRHDEPVAVYRLSQIIQMPGSKSERLVQ